MSAFWETPDIVSPFSSALPLPSVDVPLAHQHYFFAFLFRFWQSFCGRIANSLASLPLLTAFELGGMHWEFRPKSVSSPNGICPEKEWISPPVSPRSADVNEQTLYDNDYDFDNAFMEWGY